MADLIGRTRELRDLQQAWEAAQRAEPQLVVLWGRRRVGKTFLLTHFAAGKRHIYFTGTRQDSERRQVDRYADLIGGGFTDWEAALRFTLRMAADQPLLVVLDEAPRLLAGRPDFADLLSAVWESRSAGTQLLLALSPDFRRSQAHTGLSGSVVAGELGAGVRKAEIV